MSIFDYKSYRAWLLALIEKNKSVRSYKTLLATAMQCQRSFLSLVLSEGAELSLDHATGLAQFLAFNEQETQYLFDLVSLERASTEKLRRHLKKNLENARKEQSNLAKKFAAPPIDQRTSEIYYSAWIYQALHMLGECPRFASVEAMAERLDISKRSAQQRLIEMESINLLILSEDKKTVRKRQPGAYAEVGGDAFRRLAKHWRTRANESIEANNKTSLHYTNICALSVDDFEKIRTILVKCLEDARKVIDPSPSDDVYALNLDWFRV